MIAAFLLGWVVGWSTWLVAIAFVRWVR